MKEKVKSQFFEKWNHPNVINVVKNFQNSKEYLFLTEKAKGLPLMEFIIK